MAKSGPSDHQLSRSTSQRPWQFPVWKPVLQVAECWEAPTGCAFQGSYPSRSSSENSFKDTFNNQLWCVMLRGDLVLDWCCATELYVMIDLLRTLKPKQTALPNCLVLQKLIMLRIRSTGHFSSRIIHGIIGAQDVSPRMDHRKKSQILQRFSSPRNFGVAMPLRFHCLWQLDVILCGTMFPQRKRGTKRDGA